MAILKDVDYKSTKTSLEIEFYLPKFYEQEFPHIVLGKKIQFSFKEPVTGVSIHDDFYYLETFKSDIKNIKDRLGNDGFITDYYIGGDCYLTISLKKRHYKFICIAYPKIMNSIGTHFKGVAIRMTTTPASLLKFFNELEKEALTLRFKIKNQSF